MIKLLEKAIEILNVFKSNGYNAYIVGGFVRDFILGKESVDIDISTNATPKDIQSLFNEVKLQSEQYGSVNIIYKKCNFEVTTFRMELEYKDNRFPSKIVYTDSLLIDLKRRDFTMNTLCMDENKEIIDILNVKDDINNHIIKSVGNADNRLKEDALRILRAIRFATILDFDIDPELQDAIFRNKYLLKDLSFYRKKQELNKILSSDNAVKGIKLLKDFGLDEVLNITIPEKVIKTNDPLGMWVQLKPSEKYPFTRFEKDYIKSINNVISNKVIDDLELYYNGNYVCYIAAQILGEDAVSVYNRYDELPITKQSDIKISRKDIIDLLELEDKSLSKLIINEIEEKIVKKELENDKDILENYLINNYKKDIIS